MTHTRVTEAQLRERLKSLGKTPEEIENMIDQYVESNQTKFPDMSAISQILQKTQEDSVLRVRGFKLSREQYDTLLNYFEESDTLTIGQQADANSLLQRALGEFINLIS